MSLRNHDDLRALQQRTEAWRDFVDTHCPTERLQQECTVRGQIFTAIFASSVSNVLKNISPPESFVDWASALEASLKKTMDDLIAGQRESMDKLRRP